MRFRIVGMVLLGMAAFLAIFIFIANSVRTKIPVVFSPKEMLTFLWHGYKNEYWDPDTGRTIDKQHDNITTSEGQSYTMLRAVWMDDKNTFDKAWQWSKDILQREDRLFSWVFGERPDGTYGVLSGGGENAASDADTDIALALIFAAERWGEKGYREEAKAVIQAIWENEVVIVNGRPVLAANNVEKDSTDKILINPSYFAPYAYRIFSIIDPQNDWESLVESSYDLIKRSVAAPLDRSSSAGLPPNWVFMDRRTGELSATGNGSFSTDYGYDAMRLPWRLALDYVLYEDPAARDALKSFGFLGKEWRERKLLFSVYAHDGTVVNRNESPAIYGGSIGYFTVADPEAGNELYETKLKSLFDPNRQTWKTKLSYYEDNWAWFGIALHNKYLVNLGPTSSSNYSKSI